MTFGDLMIVFGILAHAYITGRVILASADHIADAIRGEEESR